jgi:DNA-binding MarR family transcriptional regulator
LIQRAADPLDGRAACLRLTPLAEEWVTRVGNAREGAIDRAISTLGAEDRAVLEAAVPAMTRLAEALANSGGAAQ